MFLLRGGAQGKENLKRWYKTEKKNPVAQEGMGFFY
jgi:hypothetical protein